MFELQSEFGFKVLLPMLHVLHMPFISVINDKKQNNPRAETLMIFESEEKMKEMESKINKEGSYKNLKELHMDEKIEKNEGAYIIEKVKKIMGMTIKYLYITRNLKIM